ncbi:MAG: hypothetical protein MR009_10420 [Sutterellaceae bacterium]|nr:hypothetical protein [Sutterellaceae bacterium]MDD7442299.1 hypothetical protein [Sutterellaceae bacterium]MDY2868009.1 hypothetical protein [Mesosutterella sp.]
MADANPSSPWRLWGQEDFGHGTGKFCVQVRETLFQLASRIFSLPSGGFIQVKRSGAQRDIF